MKSKTGETRSGLKRKLAELEQEWDTVCESANARQQKLEEAIKKVCTMVSLFGYCIVHVSVLECKGMGVAICFSILSTVICFFVVKIFSSMENPYNLFLQI